MSRSKTRSRRQRQQRARRQPVQLISQPSTTLAHILSISVLDHVLGWLLARPRVLQAVGVCLGIGLVGLALHPLLASVVSPPPAAKPTQMAPTNPPSAAQASSTEEAAIELVAAYNQASITAALVGRADVMAPYLAPDGSAWTDSQAEYQRRAARGETHNPALTRWGVLRVAVSGDAATVETQEQWDDQTSVGGQVISSRRGILTQNVYELRRVPTTQRWQIATVTTTSIID